MDGRQGEQPRIAAAGHLAITLGHNYGDRGRTGSWPVIFASGPARFRERPRQAVTTILNNTRVLLLPNAPEAKSWRFLQQVTLANGPKTKITT